MWELDHKEGWVPKNWCFWTVVLEKTLESPVVSKEIKTVTPKGGQPWIFIGTASAEAEAPILWPYDAKSWLTGKDPDPGKDSGQEEKWAIEDEMVGWHHLLNGHEFEHTPGDIEGQGNLACCSPWGCKEVDMTEQLNNNYKVKLRKFLWNAFLLSKSSTKYHLVIKDSTQEKKWQLTLLNLLPALELPSFCWQEKLFPEV